MQSSTGMVVPANRTEPVVLNEDSSVKSTPLYTSDEPLTKRLAFIGENEWTPMDGMMLYVVPSPENGTPLIV